MSSSRVTEIKSDKSSISINFNEVWRYRDLLKMLIKRDVIIVYKQTILGPLWFVLQPVLTAVIFTFVFGNIAGLPSDGLPKFAFYLSGLVLWNFFADAFIKTSDTFFTNQNIFGKVYFPRLIIPFGITASAFIKFTVQLLLFIVVCCYHYINGEASPSLYLLALPVVLIITAMLSTGLGLVFTSLTTKYRDLKFLLQFGVQLIMWLSPVIYPLSIVSESPIRLFLLKLNPITHLLELVKKGFLGSGFFEWGWLLYALLVSGLIFLCGIVVFNKTEKDFIDRI